jgi:Protein of unknown function (DUF2924)
MDLTISREVAALRRLSPKELRQRYAEVFGETTATRNKDWLLKRIAWRLQALAEGDLSERARKRAAELANDADLRTTPPRGPRTDAHTSDESKAQERVLKFQPDDRLPPPGTVITRNYKGETLQVKVLADGFEYAGRVFPSLSAVAKHITGSHCNGFLFFRMGQKGGKR